MSRDRDTTPDDREPTRPGVHAHPHRHEDELAPHRHPHHHTHVVEGFADHTQDGIPAVHEHGHGMSFERYTWIVSPVHSLDPRMKIVAALAIVLTVVLSGPPRLLELTSLAAFLLGVTMAAKVPPTFVLGRSLLVVPFAGMIALFAPLQSTGGSLSVGGLAGAYSDGGWIAAYAILAKAWLATLTMVVLAATTPVPRLVHGLEALHVPDVILTLVTFIYRYVATMRERLTALTRALESRAPALGRWGRVRLYGNLAGALFLRSYERGERIHQAMLSRGYTGTLPSPERLAIHVPDVVAALTVGLAVAALALYR